MILALKKYILPVLSYFILTLLFILPQLFVHYPSLIDDGTDLLVVRDAPLNWLISDQLFNNSRTWPLRLVYRWTLESFFQQQIHYHFLFQSILLFLIVLLSFIILLKSQVIHKIAQIGVLLVFFIPSIVANFYRLGTAEHLQLVIFLFAILFLVNKKWLTLCFLIANCFVKETSVFFLLLPVCYELAKIKKNFSYIFVCLLSIVFYLSFLVWKFFVLPDQYVQRISISFDHFQSILLLSPLTTVILVLTIFFLIFITKKKIEIPQNGLALLLAFLLSVPAFFIWQMNQYYYHLNFQVLGCISLILIYDFFLKRWESLSKVLIYFGGLIFFIFTFYFSTISLEEGLILHKRHLAEGALVKFLWEKNWSEYNIFSRISDDEHNNKIYMYAMEWYPETRGKTFTPTMERWSEEHTNMELYREGLASEASKEFFKNEAEKKILIGNLGTSNILSSDFQKYEICGSSPFVEKACEFEVWMLK